MDNKKTEATESKEKKGLLDRIKPAQPTKSGVKQNRKPFEMIVNYLKEVRAEIKKVVWPTTKQLINNTAIVLISLAIIGVFIWGLDIGFGTATRAIFSISRQTTQQVVDDTQALPLDVNDLRTEETTDTTEGDSEATDEAAEADKSETQNSEAQ